MLVLLTLSLTACVNETKESRSSWGVWLYWSGLVRMSVPVSFNFSQASVTLAAWGERGGERDQFCQEDFERATNRKESIYCETSTLMDEGV